MIISPMTAVLKYALLLISLTILTTSCAGESSPVTLEEEANVNPEEATVESLNAKASLILYTSVELNENLLTTSDSQGRFEINEERIIHLTHNPVSIVSYDYSGKQKTLIGGVGNGPFQYQSPSQIQLTRDTLHLVDMEGNYFQFHADGRPVMQKRLSPAVYQNFIVDGNTIYLYTRRDPGNYYIHKFDVNSGDLLAKTGKGSANDEWLNIRYEAGGMFIGGDSLYYILPSELSLFSKALGQEKIYRKDLTYPNFIQKDFAHTFQEVQDDPDLMVDYIMSRTAVSGLFLMDDYVLISLVNPSKSSFEEYSYLLFDKNLEYIDEINLTEDFVESYGNRVRSTLGNKLMFYNETVVDDGVKKLVTLWELAE